MQKNTSIKRERVSEDDEMDVDTNPKLTMKTEPLFESDSDSDYATETESKFDQKTNTKVDWKPELDSSIRDELTKRFPNRFDQNANSSSFLIEHKHLQVILKSTPAQFEIVPATERKTLPYLSRYEHRNLLTRREIELQNGLPSTLPQDKLDSCDCNFRTIAELELEELLIPIVILRPVGANRYEAWRIDELIIANKLC